MKRQLRLIGALLHKDFRIVWIFALLNASLIGLGQFPSVLAPLGPLGFLLQTTIALASVVLILVVFHEDAIVSLNQDWLTRPIPGLVLLLAKSAFVVFAIMLPAVLGGMAYNLYQGHSVGESLLSGLATGAGGSGLIFNLVVMAFAAVTANLRQAIIALLAGIASLTVLVAITLQILGIQGMGFTGTDWVVGRSLQIMLGLVAVSILLVQYALRHTRAARVIAGVVVIAAWVVMLPMTGPRVFAMEKFLMRDAAAAALIRIELVKGCFPAHAPNGEDESRIVGPGAFIFRTRNVQEGIPAGDRLSAGPVLLTYRVADQVVRTLYAEWPSPQGPSDGGLLATTQNWLLPRKTYEQLAHNRNVQTEIHYFLSLLAPEASAEFQADGRREFYPRLGYCGATFNPESGVVNVDCFKAGPQPAQIVATLAGTPPSAGTPSGFPDFTPAVLDFWGGRRYLMRLRAAGNGVPRIQVTAFTALAHFDRRIVVPGILGGPVSACPAP